MKRVLIGMVALGALSVGLFVLPILMAQQPPAAPPPPPRQENGSPLGPGPGGPGAFGPGDGFGPGGFGPGGFGPGGFGPGGFGPGGFGPGGFGGGPGRANRKLVDQYDRDGDGRLNAEERADARTATPETPGPGQRGPGQRGPGGGPGFPGRGMQDPPQPGKHIEPADVTPVDGDVEFYDTSVLRTIFLNFENADWEAELSDFNNTDVEVPATMVVDGKTYHDVGIHFRGMSSYFMVPAGFKRSLNVAVDFVHEDQRVGGYKTLNLLNANGDPSLMSSVLYSNIARDFIPAPKANFVKVVINGEFWGVYVNVQQFNKDFIQENYDSRKGARWKVSGSPNGDGGLRYLGTNIDDYRSRYELKSNEDKQAWQDLINLCRVLGETPVDELEAALEPILDIDAALWFLALDVALINSDGYWVRASDYSIFLDADHKFHLIPHDMNEAFHGAMSGPGGRPGGGPGGRPGERDRPGRGEGPGSDPVRGPDGRRGPGGMRGPGRPGEAGLTLDPLVAIEDPNKPLRSRLLQVPALRAKYLSFVRTIAEQSLTWEKIGPMVAEARDLLSSELADDTRKLSKFEDFQAAMSDDLSEAAPTAGVANAQPTRAMSIRVFVEQRSAFLMNHAEVAKVSSVKTPARER